ICAMRPFWAAATSGIPPTTAAAPVAAPATTWRNARRSISFDMTSSPFVTFSSVTAWRPASAGAQGGSVVQQAIELGPDLVLLGAGDVAEGAFRLRPHLRGRGLRLVMIEVVVTPSPGIRESPGVLDGHIGA